MLSKPVALLNVAIEALQGSRDVQDTVLHVKFAYMSP